MPLLDPDVIDELMREWAVLAGERLRAARLAMRATQVTAADLAGTTPETWCRVELGQLTPREPLRAALSTAVGKDIADIWPPFTRRELLRRARSAEAA